MIILCLKDGEWLFLSFTPYGQIYPKGGDDVFRGFLKPSPKKNENKAKVISLYVDTYNMRRK